MTQRYKIESLFLLFVCIYTGGRKLKSKFVFFDKKHFLYFKSLFISKLFFILYVSMRPTRYYLRKYFFLYLCLLLIPGVNTPR